MVSIPTNFCIKVLAKPGKKLAKNKKPHRN
jgi:hypothetical protein